LLELVVVAETLLTSSLSSIDDARVSKLSQETLSAGETDSEEDGGEGSDVKP
jgi:hypothetical protein